MRDAAIDPRDFVFADLGSGKGRVLLLASHFGFRRVIGIEISPSLYAIAARNVERYKPESQQCRAFDLQCGDARTWDVPTDANVFVYLFQPFPANVLGDVLAKLRESLEAHPREIVIAYLNPIFDAVVAAAGFHLLRRGSTGAPGDFSWAIYSNRAPLSDAHDVQDPRASP
jgi:SAM-dependent methyltransferase